VDTDLAGLLAAGEREAFHGRPVAAVSDLERAVVLAQQDNRYAEVSAAGWLLGVALSAAGRYGRALRVLTPLLEAGEAGSAAPETRLFGALAAATAASVHRGLGRHPDAESLDDRGLRLTDGTGEPGFDCVLGLASDAVGLGQVDAARARLGEAEALAAEHGAEWWRQRVRLAWVRTEVLLLEESPEPAIAEAASSVEAAEQASAPRHVAKGLLFQGVAELSAGRSAAPGTLRRAATLAEGLAILPIGWQARALLGALLADSAPEESAASLAAARGAVSEMAEDLPDALREEWLSRPNVSAVLQT
jgi:hypothetical protein